MGTIENVKEMVILIKNLGDLDLYRRILDLQGEIIDLTGAKRSLEEENHELKKQLEFSKKDAVQRAVLVHRRRPCTVLPFMLGVKEIGYPSSVRRAHVWGAQI